MKSNPLENIFHALGYSLSGYRDDGVWTPDNWRRVFNLNHTRDALGLPPARHPRDSRLPHVEKWDTPTATVNYPGGAITWRLLPTNTPSRTGGTSGHRVQLQCPACGQWMGAGRGHAHRC